MLSTLKHILLSKGFWKAILGSAIASGAAYLHAPQEVIAIIGGLFGTSVIAQGMSDLGKNSK